MLGSSPFCCQIKAELPQACAVFVLGLGCQGTAEVARSLPFNSLARACTLAKYRGSPHMSGTYTHVECLPFSLEQGHLYSMKQGPLLPGAGPFLLVGAGPLSHCNFLRMPGMASSTDAAVFGPLPCPAKPAMAC